MNYHFKNLVFEGGGVKGIAYVGALRELVNRAILKDIARVGGTSAGAITAILVGLNYSLDEIDSILRNLDFKKFMDDSWGIIRDTDRLIKEFGWYKGDYFRTWIGELIGKKTGKPDATFAQVQQQKADKGFRDMYFMGTNISTHFSEVFSHEHTPRMCVADAVRIDEGLVTQADAPRGLRNGLFQHSHLFLALKLSIPVGLQRPVRRLRRKRWRAQSLRQFQDAQRGENASTQVQASHQPSPDHSLSST